MAAASGRSPKELQKVWSSYEFSELQVYLQMEPMPHEQIVFTLSMLCALVANLGRAEGQKAATPQDFLPTFDEDDKPANKRQTVDEMKAILWDQARVVNAKVKENERRAGVKQDGINS